MISCFVFAANEWREGLQNANRKLLIYLFGFARSPFAVFFSTFGSWC
jgi:hypothetical protein